jgi:hypothetical protein
MRTIHVREKADKEGTLQLRIPGGKPNVEYEVVLVIQPNEVPAKTPTPEELGWPPGYFDLAGSIDDETFIRHPQGELPKPVDFDELPS